MGQVGLYIAAAWLAVFTVELLAGRHRGIYRKEDVLVTLGCQAISSAITRPLAALMIAWLLTLAVPSFQGALANMPFWPSYLVVMVVADFCFYWGHRWAHTKRTQGLDWLWKLHRTHHAGKYFNVTVTLRVNPFWSLVVPTSWVLGFAVYLGQGKAAAVTLATVFIWNLLTHTSFRWDEVLRRHSWTRGVMSVFEHVLISPSLHRAHHGYGRDGKSYKNFAVMFSFIDWAFGTLHIPEGPPEYYGLPGPNPHWLEETLYPLVQKK